MLQLLHSAVLIIVWCLIKEIWMVDIPGEAVASTEEPIDVDICMQ